MSPVECLPQSFLWDHTLQSELHCLASWHTDLPVEYGRSQVLGGFIRDLLLLLHWFGILDERVVEICP